MSGTRPIHHDPNRIQELTKELLIAGAIGGVKGAAIGGSTDLILRSISSTFRHARMQVKVWYHVTWISMGIVFWAEKQLVRFEKRVAKEERDRESKILDEAADRGIFIES